MDRSTKEELAERVEATEELLCQGLAPGAVKTALRERFGDLSARTCERLMKEARENLARGLKETDREELRAVLVGNLMRVLSAPESRGSERVRAVEAVAHLLGLAEPTKSEVALSVPQPRPRIEINFEELRRLRREVFGSKPQSPLEGKP